MKSVSPALASHLAGEVTTLATLWRVVRCDGVVFTFTDHDSDIAYGGEAYACALGYQHAAISAGAELAVDETELLGLLDSGAIDPKRRHAGHHAEWHRQPAERLGALLHHQMVARRRCGVEGGRPRPAGIA